MDQITEATLERTVCNCGKPIEQCGCAQGEACECGGDPALCHNNQTQVISLSGPLARE